MIAVPSFPIHVRDDGQDVNGELVSVRVIDGEPRRHFQSARGGFLQGAQINSRRLTALDVPGWLFFLTPSNLSLMRRGIYSQPSVRPAEFADFISGFARQQKV